MTASGVLKQQLISWWDSGYYVNMGDSPDVDSVASLLKYFLTALPIPLMTFTLFDQFLAVQKDPLDCLHRLEGLRNVLQKLPAENRNLLECILKLLKHVTAHRKLSLMDARNLATIFAPAFFRPPPEQVELAKDINVQIKLCQKLIKFFPAHLAENSVEMLNSACQVLIDESRTKEEIQASQHRHWHAWAKNLMDPTCSFVGSDGTSASFAQILFESEAIDLSIQSALLFFPRPDTLPYLEQLLSLLSDIPISTVLSLLEGFSETQLSVLERAYFGMVLSSHKDIDNFGGLKSSPDVDWRSQQLTEYPIEEEELKNQLQATERAALALRQSEQDREQAAKRKPKSSSASRPPPTEIIAFLHRERRNYEEKLSLLNRDRENHTQGKEVHDPQEIQLEKGLITLCSEYDDGKKKIQDMRNQLEAIESAITEHAVESSLEHQRYKDELEEVDSNIENKQQELKLFTQAENALGQFFRGPFDANHRRLMQRKLDLESALMSNTSLCPPLIHRYLEAVCGLFQEIRKRMKRALKDKTHIKNTYGDSVASTVESEYLHLQEAFHESLVESEEVASIYLPIVRYTRK